MRISKNNKIKQNIYNRSKLLGKWKTNKKYLKKQSLNNKQIQRFLYN